jgi:hypothetical protein
MCVYVGVYVCVGMGQNKYLLRLHANDSCFGKQLILLSLHASVTLHTSLTVIYEVKTFLGTTSQ